MIVHRENFLYWLCNQLPSIEICSVSTVTHGSGIRKRFKETLTVGNITSQTRITVLNNRKGHSDEIVMIQTASHEQLQ